MRKSFVWLGLLLVGCGPASQRPVADAPGTRTIDFTDQTGSVHRLEMGPQGTGVLGLPVPAEQLWIRLPQVYQELGLGGQILNARERVYGQPGVTVHRRLGDAPLSRFLDCGSRAGIQNANSYRVQLSVETRVQARDERNSVVRTQVQASARPPGGSDLPVRCGSTHELERRIHSMLVVGLIEGS